MPNARLSERAPFIAEVDILATGAPVPRRVWGSDVSETGIFLQTTHPFRVGDRVSLRFDVAAQEVHVRAAEVMWVRPFEPVSVDGRMPGIGIKFLAVDPPTRAALRRFTQPHVDDSAEVAGVVGAADPAGEVQGDVTQPEGLAAALAPLPGPTSSLPPVTASILQTAAGGGSTSDEQKADSLPPFSQMPSPADAPPPERFAVLAEAHPSRSTLPMGTPRPVTILPDKKPSTPPSPLAGWTFRRDDFTGLADARVAAEEQPATGLAGLDLRFDDEADTRSGRSGMSVKPSLSDEPILFDVSSSPPECVARDGDEPGAGPLELPARAFEEGSIAMRHLPIAEERRPAPVPSARRHALPIALGLLCAGTLVGVGLGAAGKELRRGAPLVAATAQEPPAPAAPAAVDAEPARSVADAERDLPRAAQPEKQPEKQPAKQAEVQPEKQPVKQLEVPGKQPEKPVEVKPAPPAATRTSRAEPAPQAAPAPRSAVTPSPDGSESLAVAVGRGRVVKTFTLEGPSRVVVDLEGATLPKSPLAPGGRVSRVRFGTPAPGTSRVVFELSEPRRARDVRADVSEGVLTVAFR
jgi:hypothetical protein